MKRRAASPRERTADEAFASYAHVDNKATYDRVLRIVEDVANGYRSLTATRLATFVDTQIPLGDVWRDRIAAGLASSTTFLPFVSPAYLRSAACRREFRVFHQALDGRLVIPLIYGDKARIEERFRADLIWRSIQKLQYLDIYQLRFEEPGSALWMKLIDPIVRRVDDAVTAVRGSGYR
jgi:F-box protein 11